ncbi:MAG: hypothetical protein ACXAEU_00410 [Candidatus Hodarchaeales archaeon]
MASFELLPLSGIISASPVFTTGSSRVQDASRPLTTWINGWDAPRPPDQAHHP